MGRYDDPAYASGSTLAAGDKIVWSTAAGTRSRTAEQVARSLERLGLNIFNVVEYGAVPGEFHSAAYQAAVDAAAAAGGGIVWFPPASGYYGFDAQVTVSTPNIWLIGAGSDISHSVGSVTASSSKWYINFSGYAVNYTSVSTGGATDQKVKAGGIRGFYINGADVGKGIKIRSVNGGIFEDLTFAYCNTSCVDVNCIDIDDAPDCQYNVFRNITTQCNDAADTGCHGFILDGTALANTSINVFERITCLHKNGDGIKVMNADNNTFRDIFTYRPTGTGYSMSFHGSSSAANQVCRENIVDNLSGDSAARFYGTGVYTYPSQQNLLTLDNGNSTPYPTIDAGATTNRFAHRYFKDLQTVAYAASITPDPYYGETINVGTLTGNITVNAPSITAHVGKKMTFIFTQDGSGGHTFTFNAVYKKISTLSTTASKISTITFQHDGTNWIEIAASVGI